MFTSSLLSFIWLTGAIKVALVQPVNAAGEQGKPYYVERGGRLVDINCADNLAWPELSDLQAYDYPLISRSRLWGRAVILPELRHREGIAVAKIYRTHLNLFQFINARIGHGRVVDNRPDIGFICVSQQIAAI